MVNPCLVAPGQINAVLCLVLTGTGDLITAEPKRLFSWTRAGRELKATFLMVKGDVYHGSKGRKATFLMVQRRQLSWILEPATATFSMAPGGQLFNGFSRSWSKRRPSIFLSSDRVAKATLFMVQSDISHPSRTRPKKHPLLKPLLRPCLDRLGSLFTF